MMNINSNNKYYSYWIGDYFMMKELLKNEIIGWKKWEISWLLVATILITVISIILGDTIMGILAAITGIICVILTGKGKLSAYLFGLVNVIAYAIIAFESKYYGEVMLNLIYYVPMQFWGFYVWSKNMNPKTNEVLKKKMTLKQTSIMLISVFTLTMIYGLILQLLNGNLPYVDALSTVISIVALYISIKMYTEQWILWIIVDVVTVFMWVIALIEGTGSVAILMMWVIYLVNAIIMYFKWRNETNGGL